MFPTEDRREYPATANTVEPSSWRPLVAIVLGAVSIYGVLAVVLILQAANAGPSGLVWLTVPGLLVCAAVAALLLSLTPVRKRLAAIGTWFVTGSSQDVVAQQPSSPSRERA